MVNDPYEFYSVIGMVWFLLCLATWVGLALWKHRKHYYSRFRLLGLLVCIGSVSAYLALAGEEGWALPPPMPMLMFDLGFSVLIAFRIYDEKYCDCDYPEVTMKERSRSAAAK